MIAPDKYDMTVYARTDIIVPVADMIPNKWKISCDIIRYKYV